MGRARRENGLGDVLSVAGALAAITASLMIATYVMSKDEPATGGLDQAAATVPIPSTESAAGEDPGALAIAKRSGPVLIGLVAREGGPIDVIVYAEEELPLSTGAVRVAVDGGTMRRLDEQTCGEACFRLDAQPFGGRPLRLEIEVERPGCPVQSVRFRLPAGLPEAGDALLARARETMLGLRTLRVEETLSAGASPVRSSWQIEAPDKLSVVASDGGETVLIGTRRWDLIDGSWEETEWSPVRQPWYAWEDAGNPRIVGRAKRGGVEVTKLALYTADPESWWFVLDVAPDGHVLRVRMLAPSHFMVDRYSGFDEPVTIEPPDQ